MAYKLKGNEKIPIKLNHIGIIVTDNINFERFPKKVTNNLPTILTLEDEVYDLEESGISLDY